MKQSAVEIQKRHEAILQLIAEHDIEGQNELVELLAVHYGIRVTQAALSRDLKRLKISKYTKGSKKLYKSHEIDVTKAILRKGILGMDCNEAMVVIHTLAGLAPFVGDWVDQQRDMGILGCLAGETVVFVMPKSVKETQTVMQLLQEAIEDF